MHNHFRLNFGVNYDLYDMCIYTQIHVQYTHTCITNKCKYLYLHSV